MIDEEKVEKAVLWLTENAGTSANARATRIYLDEYRKSLKALIMKEHLDKPVSAQEREALAHPKYIAHLEELKKAVFNDENMRALRTGAEAKIEAWRTKQANIRAIKI